MTEIEKACITRIASAKGIDPETLNPDTTLDAIGVDSLDRVSLAFDLEEQYGVEIPESRLHTIRTVADVAQAVEEILHAKGLTASNETGANSK